MRDLRLNSSANNFKKYFLLALVLAFLLFGLNFLRSQVKISGGGASVILRDAPYGLKPVDLDESALVGGGVNLTTQTTRLVDVKYGGEAVARATRSFGGGLYILSVDAILPDPVNTNYQVWLVSGDSVLPIDYMRGAKTSWSLSLRDRDKYSSYRGIWITLERSKDDKPEEHVMEGSF